MNVIQDADPKVRLGIANFIKEFNKREWMVRIASDCSFSSYYSEGHYQHKEEFGTGFVVNNRSVPYFHPNRSFHDEIIWLNEHLFYDDSASFADKLLNAAIVKFYGPSNTLDIITGNRDFPYLKKTGSKFISYERMMDDPEYFKNLHLNIENAFSSGERIWGTTELRTSLQTASRNYSRAIGSVIDEDFGLSHSSIVDRKMRPSDMITWIRHLVSSVDGRIGWLEFYKSKPTMQESFEYLTKERGIGNYYGYHFSSNLARMPGIGSSDIIEVDYKDEFSSLKIPHGNLDENDAYVMAGPGAMASLSNLYPSMKFNSNKAMEYIIAIRDCQEEFFMIKSDEELRHLREATELGRFTTFGCEISLCQYNVFSKASQSASIASKRAAAPISQEAGESEKSFCPLDDFFK